MLVHSRTMAPTSGVAADELPRPVHHVLSRKLDVELVLVVQDDAGELPAVFGSRDRCVERSSREGEVLLGERSPRNGEDAGPFPGREQSFDGRYLHERRSGDRHPAGARQLRLMEGEEAAARGEPVRADANEALPRLHEGVEETGCPLPYHPVRGGVAHDPVEHREGPGVRVPDVARNAGEAGLQHQDADACAVDRFAASLRRSHDWLPLTCCPSSGTWNGHLEADSRRGRRTGC